MSTSVAQVDAAQDARRKTLEKYLKQLKVWNAGQGSEVDPESAASIGVGAGELVVEPWGRSVLGRHFVSGQEDEVVPGLVAHGLALAMKSMMDIQRLGRADYDDATLSSLQDELIRDSEVGSTLIREMQSQVQGLIAGGEVEAARNLTNLKNKISEIVSDTRVMIADVLPETPRPQESEKNQGFDMTAEQAARAVRRARHVPTARPGREPATGSVLVLKDVAPTVEHPRTVLTRPLTVALLVALALWLGMVIVPAQMHDPLIPISRGDFPSARLLAGVEARPPSLYATVNTRTWDKLTDPERIRLIDEVGKIVGPNGYRGARISSETGKPLARWLRDQGSMLVGDGNNILGTPAR